MALHGFSIIYVINVGRVGWGEIRVPSKKDHASDPR